MSNANRPSRRTFLKGGTAAAAGLALAGGLNIARTAHAAGSEELKIALIGCGGRGTAAVADCVGSCENVKLIAVADAFAVKTANSLKALRKDPEIAAKIDVPADRVFVGLDAYQKAIDCGPDIVLLAGPPGFRPVHYAAAVNAGKHIFMEKPCCVDAPGYRSIVETNKLADGKNLKVVVGLQRHHDAKYIQGIRDIHDGKLGKVQFLRVYWNGLGGGAHDLGKRPQNDPKEMEFQIGHWGCFLWLYGDNIVEQHVHNIDVGNWVMAKDGDVQKAHPVEASGIGGRVNPGNYGDVFDHHSVEFTYADGTKMFSQCRHIIGTKKEVAEYVHTDNGSRAVAIQSRQESEGSAPYKQEQIDLIKAIRDNVRINEGWYGAVSSMTAVLGRMATYSGQDVRWDDAVAKGPDESPEKLAWDAQPRHVPGADGLYPFPVPGIYKPY